MSGFIMRRMFMCVAKSPPYRLILQNRIKKSCIQSIIDKKAANMQELFRRIGKQKKTKTC